MDREQRFLIVRSAGQPCLRALLDLIARPGRSIHVLSPNPVEDPRIDAVFPILRITRRSVSLGGTLPDSRRYDKVFLLLDLRLYTLLSYRKFSRFVEQSRLGDCVHVFGHWNGKLLGRQSSQLTAAFRTARRRAVAALGYGLRLLLAVVRPITHVRLCDIRVERIGHLAANNESFLRKAYLEKDRGPFVLVSRRSDRIANRQLFTMLARRVPVVRSSLLADIITSPTFRRSPSMVDLWSSFRSTVECRELDAAPPQLRWLPQEESQGAAILAEMGVDSWFACFHTRDDAYLNATFPDVDWCYHDFRDADIHDYLPAMRRVAALGGYAIRVGSIVKEPLRHDNHPRIIDYSTSRFQSDFMDVYLAAKCAYFVGSTAGLYLIATIFNVPLVVCNGVFGHTGLSSRELMVPKNIWSVAENRLLTFGEVYRSGASHILSWQEFRRHELRPVANTPDDIAAATEELHERAFGTARYSEDDELRQQRFRDIYRRSSNQYYEYPSRIGRGFLSTYEHLLVD